MKDKFKNAFRGIAVGLKHQSILIQFILAALAVTAGAVMRLNTGEWIAVVICIGSVISSEMLNTCVEKLCDMYSTEIRDDIRDIKDIAAGAVLVSSIASLITAIVILIIHVKEI